MDLDNQSFAELYQKSYPVVKSECLKVLHNPVDAEDAIQESYIHIFQKMDTVKDPNKFLGWCKSVAHNTSVDYIIHNQRKAGKDDFRPPVSSDTQIGMDALDGEDTDLSPEEQAEENVVHELLQQAVDSLPPQRAMCLALSQQGYKYDQIAKQLSIPVGTVKSNVFYAKQALKKEISKIERREHIQVHGFVLVPAAGKVTIQMQSPQSGGFIQAELNNEAYNLSAHNNSKTSAHQSPVWKVVLSVTMSAVIIAGGIGFTVNRAEKDNFSTPIAKSSSQNPLFVQMPEEPINPYDAVAQYNAYGTEKVPRNYITMRVSPSKNSAEVVKIPDGSQLKIKSEASLDKVNNIYYVFAAYGNYDGWVRSDFIVAEDQKPNSKWTYVAQSSQLTNDFVDTCRQDLIQKLKDPNAKIIQIGFSRANDLNHVEPGHAHNSLDFVVQSGGNYTLYEYTDFQINKSGSLSTPIYKGNVRSFKYPNLMKEYLADKPGDVYHYEVLRR